MMSAIMTSPSLASQNVGHWYRGIIRGKTRVVIAWVFAILLILSAHIYPTWPGLVLCFIGAALRYWASGYLRKDQHPAVGGPYALTRNPLYLGTWLMAIGIAWSIENPWLTVAGTVIFGAIYHFIILDEETKLEGIFGDHYTTYCKTVPRFLPRLFPPSRTLLLKINPTEVHLNFSRELAKKNKAHESFVTFFALWGFVSLLAWVWIHYGREFLAQL